MKILIVSQYFWPEEFRVNDLALDLVKRGHDITILTGNPNYPKGEFVKGYGFKYSVEFFNQIKIYRVPILPRGHNSLSLILNYLSFIISGSLFALFHKGGYDKLFAVNYSPITAVYPAIVYKKLHKVKLYLWVQDLWPESVTAAGKINSKVIMNTLEKIVKHIYRKCDKILVQSEAFIPSVQEKGVTIDQIGFLPNWAEDLYCDDLKIDFDKFNNLIPSGFRIMFAGNIGEAQDFESIIKAAELTKEYPEIKWIIIGDGRKKKWVENEIERLGLKDTVYLLGRYPVDDMPSFFVHSDLLLVTLKDEDIFAFTIPGKVQSYIAFGKPIIGMLNGKGAEIIKNTNCGLVSDSSDYKSLAENIINCYNYEPKKLMEMGENGKKYYHQNFSKNILIDKLIQIFKE